MLIRVAEAGERLQAQLEQPDDFKRLSVLAPPGINLAEAADKLSGVRFVSQRAWIDVGWLRRSGGYDLDPGRSDQFEAMVEFARGKGWVHPATGELAAHVERVEG